ncbi:MAG: hypothetical protein HC796_07585 [Synechococcaceae cyanobacterium RL_1_2]|nr:hypothetical protein [Synechococcaceae cyanobacterium RL_1_2]
MVKTAAHVNLSELEQLLHQRLYAEPLRVLPLQVRCLLQKNSILIFVEHPHPQLDHPGGFRIVRQMLEDEKFLQGDYQILLYLKTHGAKKPYSFHNLNGIPDQLLKHIPLESLTQDEEAQEEFPTLNDDSEIWNSILAQVEQEHPQEESVSEEEITNMDAESFPMPKEGEALENLEPPNLSVEEVEFTLEEADESSLGFHGDRVEQGDEEEATLTDFSPVQEMPKNRINKPVLWGLLFSAGLFCSTFYLLTRPCVLGQCTLIGQAQTLADTSAQIGAVPIAGQAILESQQDLKRAIAGLNSIPFWSGKHQTAQQLLTVYRKRDRDLDGLVEALKAGAKAGQMANSTLLTSQRWQEVRQQWQTAIVLLEQISPDSDYYSFAQQKIPEYTQNLKAINSRLEEEQGAVTSISEAKTAAKIAEVRQGVAQSLEDWTLAESTWQTAIDRLESISPQSTTYAEAQTLLDRYRTELVSAQEQRTAEAFAARAYNKALELKVTAKSAESDGQWSTAVSSWRTGLTSLEQIANDSFYYKQAQSLKPEYREGLKAAEAKLNTAAKNQQVLKALEQTCGQRSTICTGKIQGQEIIVTFTPTYLKEIANTAQIAQNKGTNNSQIQLIKHIATLEEAFQAIARTSKIPVSVYHPDGQLIFTYQP